MDSINSGILIFITVLMIYLLWKNIGLKRRMDDIADRVEDYLDYIEEEEKKSISERHAEFSGEKNSHSERIGDAGLKEDLEMESQKENLRIPEEGNRNLDTEQLQLIHGVLQDIFS